MPDRDDPIQRVHQAVRESFDRTELAQARLPLIVAVSGGADSLGLLDALVAVLPNAGERLVVGHIDHLLRPESADDAVHVQAIAAGYGIRCEVLRVDVPKLMADQRLGLEEAARMGRYRALRDLAQQIDGFAVLTGHTRDDSVETVLMHLLRGTGHLGLEGIRERDYLACEPDDEPSKIVLLRPLLTVGRAETSAYCAARGIRWLTDPSNSDPRMLRNRVRHHLLPVLRTYNPAVDEALDRLSTVMRDEEANLREATIRQHREMVRYGQGVQWIDLRRWASLDVALQRRLVREIAGALGAREMSFDAVERALAVGTAEGPSRAELGHGIIARRASGDLIFERPGSADDTSSKGS